MRPIFIEDMRINDPRPKERFNEIAEKIGKDVPYHQRLTELHAESYQLLTEIGCWEKEMYEQPTRAAVQKIRLKIAELQEQLKRVNEQTINLMRELEVRWERDATLQRIQS